MPSAGPHGLAIAGDLLLCAADGASLVALRRASGEVVGRVPLEGVPDVIWHDPASGRAYIAIGEPGLVQVVDVGALRTEEVVPTEAGAHTTAWDAERRRLYAFCPASCGAQVFAER